MTEGTIEAPDRLTVAKQLRANGEMPIAVYEAKKKGFSMPSITIFGGGISTEDRVVFCRNLSGMLTAGLALRRALEILRKQSRKKKMQDVLDVLTADIDKGGTLSGGMAKFPKVFSSLFVSMVKAGEESGGLSEALKEIGQHQQKSHELTRKVKGALTYPSIVLAAIVGVGVLMLMYVVPTLTKTFTELNVALPASTRLIIGLSNLLAHHTLFLAAMLFIAVTVGYFFFRLRAVRVMLDALVLRLPLFGSMITEINAARTARTLSSLLAAGIDVTRALTITQEVLQNSCYKRLLAEAIHNVEKGVPLSEAFRQNSKLYPVMVGEMMAVGEETGRLTGMLGDVALFYEDEVDAKTKNLSTIIEPVLMVLVGGAVGFFAVSMITPMYSLVNSI